MNFISNVITVMAEEPALVLLFVLVSAVVSATLFASVDPQQQVTDDEIQLAVCSHHDWRLTWPRVDDEWTGVVNIVCNGCQHTERMPTAWSTANVFPWA